MKLRECVKKGLVVIGIYLVITICLLLSTERMERLDSNLLNNNGSVSLSFNK